jgi:hypothetical protein
LSTELQYRIIRELAQLDGEILIGHLVVCWCESFVIIIIVVNFQLKLAALVRISRFASPVKFYTH